MSFTQDVKQEVSLRRITGDEERAELSALIQMTSSLSISSQGMCILVTTENAAVSRAIFRMMKECWDVDIEPGVRRRMNLNKNLIYNLRVYGNVTQILKDLGIYSARGLLDKPLQKIVQKDSCARAYLAGAFMADGSVNSPGTTNYHLEIKAANEAHAGFLIELLSRFYINARQKIADFLRCIGAEQCLLEFENERISRDFANNVQRLNNVDVANEVKSMKAANSQLEDIRVLEEAGKITSLDPKIRDIVQLRKENPEATLNELAEKYRSMTGIVVSKSGMKHRFVKLHELAEKEKGEQTL